MYHRGLPETALSKTSSTDLPWSTTDELLAQLIEEVSVLVADHRRKEPRKVPRPDDDKPKPPPKQGLTESPSGSVRAVGAKAFLTHAAARGQVRGSS